MNNIVYLFYIKLFNAIIWDTLASIVGTFILFLVVMTIISGIKDRVRREEMKRKIEEKLED